LAYLWAHPTFRKQLELPKKNLNSVVIDFFMTSNSLSQRGKFQRKFAGDPAQGKHTKNTRATMVCLVDEDVVIGTTINHLATSTLNAALVSQNRSKEVANCHIRTGVVLDPKREF